MSIGDLQGVRAGYAALDAHLSVHEDAIRARGLRTKLLASNIANADTPDYKAVDLSFGDTLATVRAGGARTIAGNGPAPRLAPAHGRPDAAHLALRGTDPTPGAGRVMYRYPDAPSLDGNTVDKDTEQARFAENAIRYRASLQFFQDRISSLIRSLKGE